MLSRETAEKVLKIAEKMRVMIITGDHRDVWDIKADLYDEALKVDRGAEITSLGVAVTGYKPITVLDHKSVSRDKWVLGGAVFVTSESIEGKLKDNQDPDNPVKIYLLPTEGVRE